MHRALVGPIRSAIASAESELLNIEDIVDGFDVENAASDIITSVESAENKRHLALVVMLSILLMLMLTQLLVTVLNAYAPAKYQPRTWCCAVTPLITFLVLITMFIMWLTTGAIYALLVLNADYCVEPDNVALRLINTKPEDTAAYYVRETELLICNTKFAVCLR